MIATPSFALTAGLLGALAAVACIRLVWWQRRAPRAERARPWRLGLLLLAQPAWALLLLLALHPPRLPPADGVMTVLTAGAPADGVRDATGRVVVLPERDGTDGDGVPPATAHRMPDLATALRLYPGTRALRILGDGFEQRDLDALPRMPLRFEPSAPGRGLASLALPAHTVAGDALRVSGRAEALPGGRAELIDPAGVRVDAVPLDEDGAFALQAPTFAEGPATFALHLRDAQGGMVEQAALPVWVDAPARPRVRLLAGAANAETRFLRRWVTDADLPLAAHVALGAGLGLGDAAAAPSRADLDRTDVLIVDTRAWTGLGPGGRATVLAAVEAGLGLLLRVDGPGAPAGLSDAAFRIEDGQGTLARPWPRPAPQDADMLRARLGAGSEDAPFDLDQARAAVPPLLLRDLRVAGPAAVAIGAADAAASAPLGWWRARGTGRVLVWRPQDTHRLVLAGRADLHADLWREAVSTVARAQGARAPQVEAPAFVDTRVVVCGIGEDAGIQAPDGRVSRLLADPRASSGNACAGYWPHTTGWHALTDAGHTIGRMFVHPGDAFPGVRAAMRRARTAAVACDGAACGHPAPGADTPASDGAAPRGPAWPWWLGWLVLTGLLWWFERRRTGRPSPP